MMASTVWLLPEPLSPTMPRVWPPIQVEMNTVDGADDAVRRLELHP